LRNILASRAIFVNGFLLIAGDAHNEIVKLKSEKNKLRMRRVILLEANLEVPFQSFEQ
jgi:hypothetical protein